MVPQALRQNYHLDWTSHACNQAALSATTSGRLLILSLLPFACKSNAYMPFGSHGVKDHVRHWFILLFCILTGWSTLSLSLKLTKWAENHTNPDTDDTVVGPLWVSRNSLCKRSPLSPPSALKQTRDCKAFQGYPKSTVLRIACNNKQWFKIDWFDLTLPELRKTNVMLWTIDLCQTLFSWKSEKPKNIHRIFQIH